MSNERELTFRISAETDDIYVQIHLTQLTMESIFLPDEWDFNGRTQFERFLKNENIDPQDVCIVGSMSLSVRGLREHHDIDICVSDDEYERLSSTQLPPNLSISRGRYEPIGLSNDAIIYVERYHDVVDGIKVVRPEVTLSYKKYRNRPKDVDDIELLEQYRNTSDGWDEQLYHSIGSASSASLLSRGIKSLQNDGIITTGIKTIGFLERRYPVLSTTRAYLPIREIKVASKRFSPGKETSSSAVILNNQYYQGEFRALDIVLGYDFLSQDSKTTFEQISKYTTEELISPSDIERLTNLQNEDPQTVSELPIRINHRYQVLNPSEFAAKLWHDLDNHNLSISFQLRSPKRENLFRTNDLSDTEFEQLQNQRIQVLKKAGALFYAILWPPSSEYHDEIEQTLGSKMGVEVLDSEDTEIGDMYSFVHAVYDAQEHHTSDRQIDEKIKLMENFGNCLRILTLELPNPRIRDGISLEMETMKNDVRQEFIPKLSEELYYSILHVTDNYRDNKRTREAIKPYLDDW